MAEYHHGDAVEVVVDGGARDRQLRAAGYTPNGEPPTPEDPEDPDADQGE